MHRELEKQGEGRVKFGKDEEFTRDTKWIEDHAEELRVPGSGSLITSSIPSADHTVVYLGYQGEVSEIRKIVTRIRKNTTIKLKLMKSDAMKAADNSQGEGYQPIYGGSTVGGFCTFAFPVLNVRNGESYMMTAGHCNKYNYGTTPLYSPRGVFEGYYGSTTFVNYGTSWGDLAVFWNGSYEGKMYADESANAWDTNLVRIVGADMDGINAEEEYAVRGNRTGHSRGWKLTPGNNWYAVGPFVVNGQQAYSTVKGVAFMYEHGYCGAECTRGVGNGDSGGPIYQGSSSGYVVSGVFSGFPTASCSYQNPSASDYGGCRSMFVTSLDRMREIWPWLVVKTS